MKGIGAIVILISMLIVGYLVVQDLDVLSSGKGRQAVIDPLRQARDTADLVQKTEDSLKEALDQIDR